jgi:hypothetical protein
MTLSRQPGRLARRRPIYSKGARSGADGPDQIWRRDWRAEGWRFTWSEGFEERPFFTHYDRELEAGRAELLGAPPIDVALSPERAAAGEPDRGGLREMSAGAKPSSKRGRMYAGAFGELIDAEEHARHVG